MKTLQYLIEAALLRILFTAFRTLPLDIASFTGGFIARSVGPFLSAHRTASRNLSLAFPDMKREEKYRLLSAMWDNLGRVAAELPHLPGEALYERVEIEGLEHLPAAD